MLDSLEKPLKTAQECKDKLGAERVQFLLNKSGEWEFNYLLTDKGQVIGTIESFSRQAHQFELNTTTGRLSSSSNGLKQLPNTPITKKAKHKKGRP